MQSQKTYFIFIYDSLECTMTKFKKKKKDLQALVLGEQ